VKEKREGLPRESLQLIGSPSVRKKVMNMDSSFLKFLGETVELSSFQGNSCTLFASLPFHYQTRRQPGFTWELALVLK